MSCCSGKGYCQFQFPDGPPLTDNPVSALSANYLFLPYGTLLEEGETVRIWTEGGQTESVVLDKKIPLEVLPAGPESMGGKEFLPWQLIALDSGMEYDELMDWYHHPLRNPETTSVVLVFKHSPKPKKTLKMVLYQWLYKLRNL